MAINERLIHTAEEAAAPSGGGTGNQEEGLILHLDANDDDSYDGDGSVWYDITNHEYTPAIDPAENFNTVTYSGAASAQSITGVGFQPDLVWIKSRNLSNNHVLIDSVRGLNGGSTYENLYTNLSNAQANDNAVNSLDSDGFSLVNSQQNANHSSYTYVAWCLKAGGAAVSNTDGDVNSNVSVNNDLGFSIVEGTGSGTGVQTVGHGLDVPPEMVLIKNVSVTDNWWVYHKDLGVGKYLQLNTTAVTANWAEDMVVNSTELGVRQNSTGSWGNLIAYCFASKRGVSKVGSYKGTGASGNKVYTGFEPAFVMFKNTSATGNWIMHDNKRDTTNPRTPHLRANTSGAEDTGSSEQVDFNADGFTLKGTGQNANSSGHNFIYLAFAAEKPDSLIDDTDLDLHLDPSVSGSVTTSTWSDQAGSNNGTLTNFSSTLDDFYDEELGDSILFDGSNDYVNVGSSVRKQLPMTVEAWLNPVTDANAAFYSNYDGTNVKGFYMRVQSDGTFLIDCYNGSSNRTLLNNTTGSIDDNKWSHVAVTFSTSKVKLYINGTKTDEVSTNSQGIGFTSSFDTTLGVRGTNSDLYKGKMGQVRVYSSELTADEVMQNYRFTKNDYPNGFNGTLSGGLSSSDWNSSGYFSFDGTDDEVTFTSSSMPSTGFSISAWFNMDNLPASGSAYGVVAWGDETAGERRSIIVWNGGSGNPHAYFSGYGSSANIGGTTELSASTWYHVVVTEENGTAKVYLNGSEDGSGSVTLNAYSGTTGRVGNTGSTGEEFDGKISDVKIFDKVLTSAEVTAEYNKGQFGDN